MKRTIGMVVTTVHRIFLLLFLAAIAANGLAGQFVVLCVVENGDAHIDVRYEKCCLEIPSRDIEVARVVDPEHADQCSDHGDCSHFEISNLFTRPGAGAISGRLESLDDHQTSPTTLCIIQPHFAPPNAGDVELPVRSDDAQTTTAHSRTSVLRC